MNIGGAIMVTLYFLLTLILILIVRHEILINQTKISAQNDYITEVLLCNPINLVDDIGTDIIKEK